jgi:hypothetical protein
MVGAAVFDCVHAAAEMAIAAPTPAEKRSLRIIGSYLVVGPNPGGHPLGRAIQGHH